MGSASKLDLSQEGGAGRVVKEAVGGEGGVRHDAAKTTVAESCWFGGRPSRVTADPPPPGQDGRGSTDTSLTKENTRTVSTASFVSGSSMESVTSTVVEGREMAEDGKSKGVGAQNAKRRVVGSSGISMSMGFSVMLSKVGRAGFSQDGQVDASGTAPEQREGHFDGHSPPIPSASNTHAAQGKQFPEAEQKPEEGHWSWEAQLNVEL
jgi:hypothetical protein